MVGVFGEARTLKYGLGSRYSASSSALLEKVKSGMAKRRRRMDFRRAAMVRVGNEGMMLFGRVGEGSARAIARAKTRVVGCQWRCCWVLCRVGLRLQ